MTGTYKAWNGQDYPWPPPSGWYLAADGRWWAQNSGPTPTDQQPHQQHQPNQTSQQPTTAQQTYAANREAAGAPVWQGPQPNQGPQANQVPQPNQGPQATYPQQYRPTLQASQTPWQQTQSPRKGNSPGLIVSAVVGAAALLLLIGVVGAFAFRNSGGTTTAGTSPSTLSTVPSTLPPTTEPPTTTAQPTTTEPEAAQRNNNFRKHLVGLGLDHTDTSDSELELSGLATCVFASISPTPGDWPELSNTLIDKEISDQVERGDTPLTNAQWRRVYDARLVFYCPDTAAKLGVTLS